jgi:hypothetical protein
MPIPMEEASKIFKLCSLRHAGNLLGRNLYSSIDLYSPELPISRKDEYERAEKIGKENGLKLAIQDFSQGEGEEPKYEPIFISVCTSVEELKKAPAVIAEAVVKLDKEIEE